MIGWIVLVLWIVGAAIIYFSKDDYGDTGEERMSNALVGGLGFILVGIGLLIMLGAGLWALF